ncbi:YopX family protein [Lysinibacillus sp. NPDC097162]|uniref:YopX family protein n=1 Tax=Lysinibacillus sp. NPDC097162 TaxID=3364140 RepID=UPI0038097953
MSREIKFRSFIEHTDSTGGPNNYSYMNFELDFHGSVNEIFAQSGIKPLNALHNRITYMQYTGLKDKSGKEIYEGDILTDHGDEGPLYIEYSTVHAAFVFVDKFDPPGTTLYTTTCISYGGFEIIGNIYENPELLEATV